MVILFKKKYEMHFQVLTNDVSRDAWGQYFCLSCNRKKFKNSILKKQKWNYDDMSTILGMKLLSICL